MQIVKNSEVLQAAVDKNQIVIAQIESDSCVPCKALQNRITRWNSAHPAVCHVYVTVEELPELCARMGVFTVPTIFVYVEGKQAIRQSG